MDFATMGERQVREWVTRMAKSETARRKLTENSLLYSIGRKVNEIRVGQGLREIPDLAPETLLD